MIATIPPLWRDADAYVQLTQNPLVATFWGHAPAYCHAAKIPLFAGEQWERWRGHSPVNREPTSSQPALTDSGIWLLIVAQHLGMDVTIFCFITAVTGLFLVRLALALTWASNALFYTFAHCVGSETLGMILIVVLVLKALRLIQKGEAARWTDWYLFAVVLVLCILSRDLNLALVALLPAAFLISATIRIIASKDRHPVAANVRQAVIAIAVGLASVAIAHVIPQNFARKTGLQPYSRIGFTFLWRLNFLDNLSPEARGALLRKVAARTHSAAARRVIALIEQMQVEKADMSCGPFMQRAILLFDGPKWRELDRALNETAFAFLLPPTPEHLQATKHDLAYALKMPSTEISSYLFATTAYYFEHKDEMLQCAKLVTFREATADQIKSIPSQHLYFRLWQGLGYNKVFVGWFLAFGTFGVAARRRSLNLTAISAFGIALTAVGLLVCGTACVLHELEPRFALTLWQLLLLSLYVVIGQAGDFIPKKVRRAAVRPEP